MGDPSAQPHDLAQQQMLTELMMVQQMQKAAELQRKMSQLSGDPAQRAQQNLRQSSVQSAAKSAHQEAAQYVD